MQGYDRTRPTLGWILSCALVVLTLIATPVWGPIAFTRSRSRAYSGETGPPQSGESGHPVGAKRRWGFHDVSGGRFESM